jgi:hypothetical protein
MIFCGWRYIFRPDNKKRMAKKIDEEEGQTFGTRDISPGSA